MVAEKQDTPGAREVIDFVSGITDTARLRIEENLPHGFVRLKVAEAERRQAQHDIRSVEDIVTELARNSRDAGAKRVLVGFQKEQARYRKLAVLDDGCGIPADMHRVVFEPRVTSKRDDFEEDRYGVHGRGMALFSIRSRVADARIVASTPGAGTAIALTADTASVPERSDQATVPRLEMGDGAPMVGSGPHNVARVLLEMSVDCPSTVFYLGSFAEILATLRGMGPVDPDGTRESIWSGVATARDARELADTSARDLGLPVSERNAYRVLRGDIRPIEPLLALAGTDTRNGPRERPAGRPSRPAPRSRSRNPLTRISSGDLEEIGSEVRGAVERVLARYYLSTAGEPRVRRSRGRLTVSFHVGPDEEDGE